MILWWIGRSTGLMAWLALWLTLVFGLLVSARGPLDKRTTFVLHDTWAIVAVIASIVHALALALNGHGVPPSALLVPLSSATLTGPVALGTLALWGLLLLAVSSWVRARLPRALWRLVHVVAPGTALLALVHGLTAGTDTLRPWVLAVYTLTAATWVGAFVLRLLLTARKRRSGT